MSDKKRFKVEKLMRNRVPEWMESKGIRYSMSKGLSKNALYHLCLKLEEEADELRELCRVISREKNAGEVSKNGSNTVDRLTDEMADILEVLRSIAEEKGIDWNKVESWRKQKSDEQGGFGRYVYINWVEMSSDNPEMKRYEDNYRHLEMNEEENKDEAGTAKDKKDQKEVEVKTNSESATEAHPGQTKGGRVAQARRHGDRNYTEGHEPSTKHDSEAHPEQSKAGKISQEKQHERKKDWEKESEEELEDEE